jgi:ubiquinone/menaquinone biosynthesis C-methylase UbiE
MPETQTPEILETLLPTAVTKLAYQAFQQSKSIFGFAHKTLGTALMKQVSPASSKSGSAIPRDVILKVSDRLNQILEVDWQDADRGIYPKRLLFDNSWEDFFRFYPMVWLDMPSIWERSKNGQFQDFAATIDTQDYPSYYAQNFHHQTDGYLSEMSANLYDLQVELLFNGGADAMRRRILAPLKTGLQAFNGISPRQIKILDIACGTGRTLKILRGMLPQAGLYGIDLSTEYLRKANQTLSQLPGELPQLAQANAEALPYQDNYFHASTCVFTLHELPGPVRQTVLNEAFRVTQPGGTFVICDSIQVSDSPELAPVMDSFSVTFHEPFYRSYVQDDLVARLHAAGFTDVTEQVHYMSKYLIARKP